MIVNPQDRVFAALASAPRRQVIAFLAQTALSTSDLAQRFGMSAPAVSRVGAHPLIIRAYRVAGPARGLTGTLGRT